MKCQTLFLKWFLGLKGVVYYEAIAMVIYTHVIFSCEDIIKFSRKSSLGILLVFFIIKLIIIITIITKTFTKIENIMNAGFFLKLAKKINSQWEKTKFSNRKN